MMGMMTTQQPAQGVRRDLWNCTIRRRTTWEMQKLNISRLDFQKKKRTQKWRRTTLSYWTSLAVRYISSYPLFGRHFWVDIFHPEAFFSIAARSHSNLTPDMNSLSNGVGDTHPTSIKPVITHTVVPSNDPLQTHSDSTCTAYSPSFIQTTLHPTAANILPTVNEHQIPAGTCPCEACTGPFLTLGPLPPTQTVSITPTAPTGQASVQTIQDRRSGSLPLGYSESSFLEEVRKYCRSQGVRLLKFEASSFILELMEQYTVNMALLEKLHQLKHRLHQKWLEMRETVLSDESKVTFGLLRDVVELTSVVDLEAMRMESMISRKVQMCTDVTNYE